MEDRSSMEFERTPRGTINNCALANGEHASECQVCRGQCPDAGKLARRLADGGWERTSLLFAVERAGGAVRLTRMATLLNGKPGNAIAWLVAKVSALTLPDEQFQCTVGVKVKRGYQYRVPAGAEPKLLPPSTASLGEPGAGEAIIPERDITVNVVAYELLVSWDGMTVPVSWPATVLERHDQQEGAFRTRIRWLMTELMLARFGLDAYREGK